MDKVDARSGDSVGEIAPTRLHHYAWVCSDHERTRHFYEDLVGLPLVAFWIEDEQAFGEQHVYSHAFYAMRDGGCLAFFSFAKPELRERYVALHQSFFVHIAMNMDKPAQNEIRARLEAEGYAITEVDHGYTHSIYTKDPDGLLVEFSVDPPNVDEIADHQRRTAHSSLAKWMAGERAPNNKVRH